MNINCYALSAGKTICAKRILLIYVSLCLEHFFCTIITNYFFRFSMSPIYLFKFPNLLFNFLLMGIIFWVWLSNDSLTNVLMVLMVYNSSRSSNSSTKINVVEHALYCLLNQGFLAIALCKNGLPTKNLSNTTIRTQTSK